MADLSKIKVKKDGVDTVYNLKDAAARQNIENARTESAQTYVKSLSASGQTITVTKGDDSTSTITTQDTTYTAATQEADGLMAADDKRKLDNIEEEAQKNAVTGVKGSAETNMRTGAVIISPSDLGLGNVENKSSEDIRDELTSENVTEALGFTPPRENTTYGVFGAATSSAAGTSGLVPAPAAGKQGSFLRGDATWAAAVAGLKGNAESSYRTGNVNLTPANLGAAAQADVEEIIANMFSLDLGTEIPSNSNLNNYTTPGTYYAGNATVAASLSNCPISNIGFKLLVTKTGYDNFNNGMQIILAEDAYGYPTISVRAFYGSNWTSWRRFATENELPAYSDETMSVTLGTVTETYTIKKYGRVATLSMNIGSTSGTPFSGISDNPTLGTIPNGFRPSGSAQVFSTGQARTSGAWASATYYPVVVGVQTDGTLKIYGNTNNIKTCQFVTFSITYITEP